MKNMRFVRLLIGANENLIIFNQYVEIVPSINSLGLDDLDSIKLIGSVEYTDSSWLDVYNIKGHYYGVEFKESWQTALLAYYLQVSNFHIIIQGKSKMKIENEIQF